MKKIIFFAVITALTAVFTACGPSVKKYPFPKTPYAKTVLEGSAKFGAINYQTGEEILPRIYDHVAYYYSGFFLVTDSAGKHLIATDKNIAIAAADEITAKDGYFSFSKGNIKGIYFLKTGKTVSGDYEKLEVDKAGNAVTFKGGLYGVVSPKDEVIIMAEFPFLIFDGENYTVAKDKNPKRPMVGKNGKINWYLAEAKVLDKNGKLVKKLTAAQAKKVFEPK